VSIPRAAGRPWKGDGVADVGEAGDVGEGALKAEAKAGVRHRAVAAQVAVPGVLVLVDAALIYCLWARHDSRRSFSKAIKAVDL
jgi:hypothetical protein